MHRTEHLLATPLDRQTPPGRLAMLFAGTDRDGVANGKITVAYRRWAAARVVEGRIYRTNAGRIQIDSIRTVNPDLIADTDAEIEAADRRNAKDVRRRLRGDESM